MESKSPCYLWKLLSFLQIFWNERSSNQRRAKYLSNSITALLTRVHFFNNKVGIADDLYADHFKESKKMSTYLVAFLVSDFRHLETITATGIKVGISFFVSSIIVYIDGLVMNLWKL